MMDAIIIRKSPLRKDLEERMRGLSYIGVWITGIGLNEKLLKFPQ